jgi:hypothetical protein
MPISIPRILFAGQGLFLILTSPMFIVKPSKLSQPGAQLEAAPDDVLANFGYVLLSCQNS